MKEKLRQYVVNSNMAFASCNTVSPPGHGGTSAQVCLNTALAWILGTAGYISGSLGELYVHRFEQAGSQRNADTPVTGVDAGLDPNTRANVYWIIYQVKAKVNVLQEFIKELDQ